jgi:hypothetical protein
MKTPLKILALVVIFIVTATQSQSQQLYALSYNMSDQMNYLSKVSPTTGTTTILSQNGLAKILVAGGTAIDPQNRRFFFLTFGDTIYSVDLDTGTLQYKNKNSLSVTHTNIAIDFNCADGTLYTIARSISTNQSYLGKIDPSNGSTTIISPTGMDVDYIIGSNTLDPINNRLLFLSRGDTINTIDLLTGNIVARTKNSLSATHLNITLAFNYVDTTLYAMTRDTTTQLSYLSKIDPITGVTTLISTVALKEPLAIGTSTLDPVGRRFFMLTLGDTLMTIDLNTGNLLSKTENSLSGTYSNKTFEFDGGCPTIPTGMKPEMELFTATISPNPFTTATVIKNNCTIIRCNTYYLQYKRAGSNDY